MKSTIKYTVVIVLLIFSAQLSQAQTASSTAGCAELQVQFTAPQAASYFWRFGDGAASVSTLQNPEHSYVQPGTYSAQLFDTEGGTQVGDDIIITVFSPIEINISSDTDFGCAPLEVNFSSTIVIDPGIEIDQIIWTFGDGSSAEGQNVSYTYRDGGVYTVSVKVTTLDRIKCDEPIIFEDFITVEGERPSFRINKNSSCDVPDDFVFTNTTDGDPATIYSWDFDNGQTLDGEGPHTITYGDAGLYLITLTATSPAGCVTSSTRSINLGSPIIIPTYRDTVCLFSEVLLTHNTIADDYLWDFTGSEIDTTLYDFTSEERQARIAFTTLGEKTFTLTATADDGCVTIETLSIVVYKPDASYELGPDITCTDEVFIGYNANDANLLNYSFNNDIGNEDSEEITRGSPTGANVYVQPERDEFYVNFRDSTITRLIVTSVHGCKDTAFNKFFLQKPEAFFVPDIIGGCIPFNVNFADLSFSENLVLIREWDFGDGTNEFFTTDDTLITHTYNVPGLHQVKLTITDENGCVDVSREIEIVAIDKDTIEVPGIPFPGGGQCPELTFCVDEIFELAVTSDQERLNLHLESDEGRYDHCWREQESFHRFQYPGVYPIGVTVEFFNIYLDSLSSACEITIEGSRSDIDYFIDCDNPYVVNLDSEKSINADEVSWYIEDDLISTDRALTYTFDERGEYKIFLESSQNGVGCTHRDSATIYITEIQANISIPAQSCASSPTPLNAAGSQDVHDDCQAGYLWIFEEQRPREVNDSILNHILNPGFQTITLVTEDINGCTDTISATTTAFDIQAEFEVDSLICLPIEIDLLDLTTADTTMVSWEWDFGNGTSSEMNPTHVFDTLSYDPDFDFELITVNLTVTDALGCVDIDSFQIQTYEIFSELFLDNSTTICQGEEITFSADDYNLGGSFLTYEWDFMNNGSSTEDSPTVTFNEAGEQLVTLTFTEDATGCQGQLDTLISVTPTPIAAFISDQDSTDFICFPEQIDFTNTSIVGDDVLYSWDFGNGAESDLENPIIPFDKGTFEVQLIVRTFDGCRDTVSRSYTLVGPEGNFTVDKDEICPGEDITFTLENSIDVSSFTWDFGDGTQEDDQTPFTHTYDPLSSVTTFTPTLILRSDDSGCELIQNIPISVSSITADFIDSTGICPGELSFFSTFINPQTIEWNIDGQVIENTSNPSVTINSGKTSIEVVLRVTDVNGCEVERIQTIEINRDLDDSNINFPNVFSPNGDAVNPTFNIVFDPDEIASEVEVVDFRVYNRWGELLYDNENPLGGWNGSYKGEFVPADVYAYYIEVAIEGCENRSKKGNVTVIK
ncbi:PKD domain-containing protein [Saprospiraceae bacterium]|nr:PKD domain-containing protein [Saprospiraceae bacterium]